MRFLIITMSFFCLLLTIPALAKDNQSNKQMDPAAMMEMYKKLATPGDPHKLFATLAGSWTTQMKEWMEPGKPPVESTGTAEIKMLLEGRFLYQEFTGQMMGQPCFRCWDRRLRQCSKKICHGVDGYHGHRNIS